MPTGRHLPNAALPPRVADVSFVFPHEARDHQRRLARQNLFSLSPSRPGIWVTWRTRTKEDEARLEGSGLFGVLGPVIDSYIKGLVQGAVAEFLLAERGGDPEAIKESLPGTVERLARWLDRDFLAPYALVTAGLLGDFVGLYNKNSYDVDSAEDSPLSRGSEVPEMGAELAEVSLFIAKWGPLQLCPHLWPVGHHCGADLGEAVPLEAIRGYVRLCVALLRIGTADRKNKVLSDAYRRINVANDPSRGMPISDAVEMYAEDPRRQTFGATISALIADSRPQQVVYWFGSIPKLVTVSQSPLLTHILLQIVDAVAMGEMFVECSNPECQKPIDTKARRRKPLPGTAPWCAECRARGVHKRASERRLRENPEQRKYRKRKEQSDGRND